MAEGVGAKVRVVRCPKCDKLLPELPDFTVYRCGGCSATLQVSKFEKKFFLSFFVVVVVVVVVIFVLFRSPGNTAKKRNPLTDYSSERSDGGDVKCFDNSESCSEKKGVNPDAGSETDRESIEVGFKREEKMLLNSGANSINSSASITENRDVSKKPNASSLHGLHSRSGMRDRCSIWCRSSRAQVTDRNSNADELVKEELEVQYTDQYRRTQQTQVSMGEERCRASIICGLPRDQMNGVPIAPYADEGPSSQQMKLTHGSGNGGPAMKQKREGANKAEYLEQDPAQLLRKLDELRDQLHRSCEVVDRPKDRIPKKRREASSSYNHQGHGIWFPEGSSSLNPDSSLHPCMPNGYSMGLPNFYPGYGEPFVSQALGRTSYHCHVQYPERAMCNCPCGHLDLDPLISYNHEGFYPQPACSCVRCYNKHQVLPAQAPPAFISNRRVPYLVNNHGFNHVDGSSVSGSRSYNQTYGSSSLYSHEPQSQQRATFPGKTDSRPCQPKAGAAPFVVCCNCFELLLLPQKLKLTVEKCFKLRCGSCFQVISLELDGKRLVTSAPPPVMPATMIGNGSNDGLNEDFPSQSHASGHPDTSYSEDYDSPGYNIQSRVENLVSPPTSSHEMTGKKYDLNFSDPEKMLGLSTCSSRSEDVESPDSKRCQRDAPSSVELPFEDEVTSDVPGLPLREHLAHPLSNQITYGSGKGSTSRRYNQEKVSFNGNFQQNSVKDVQAATEIDLSVDEYSNPDFSQDSWEVRRDEEQPRIGKDDDSFFAGLIKKTFKDISLFNQSVKDDRSKVSINGHPISDHLVKKAEKLAGPVYPGEYWYDYRAGFWGVMGHPCLGIIPVPIQGTYFMKLLRTSDRGLVVPLSHLRRRLIALLKLLPSFVLLLQYHELIVDNKQIFPLHHFNEAGCLYFWEMQWLKRTWCDSSTEILAQEIKIRGEREERPVWEQFDRNHTVVNSSTERGNEINLGSPLSAVSAHPHLEGPPRRSERGEEVDKGKEREKEVVDEDKEAVTTIVLEDEDVDTIYSEDGKMSTPFIVRMSMRSGSLGMMMVVWRPSMAMSWRAPPLHLAFLHQGEPEPLWRSRDGWGLGVVKRDWEKGLGGEGQISEHMHSG
ncbi:putative protein ENHANCED DISEASE RESISTANCE 4 [Cocos nucifera]|uniref:Zinc-ribbon domain-containing protein n=1 Tax=Cocos nucifera TaxID=13894 RepID=A0A8K0N2F4_COCNU|nr:putative protein ENHANCED DISEASE RESISTANCE 4 [Cocos nucifera]